MLGVGRAAQVVAGLLTALAVPLHLRGWRLSILLVPPPGPATGSPVPELAIRANRWALRWLGRLPGWRNTCLYRSIGECLVLRAYGVPAVVRLGVRADGPAADVAAHAWVERPGSVPDRSAETYRPLVEPVTSR